MSIININDSLGEEHNELTQSELPNGHVEERVQVDRRKLENMILGVEENVPNAEDYFEQVSAQSGTKIQWPSRLKIGAKTKKDPFIKIIGPVENVKNAKKIINSLLKIKKHRITLKIEIPHAEHSHVIGRRGKNTQEIMQKTHCHIHFPDSNKHSDAEKNNQVSIAGSTLQTENSRSMLRKISPVIITIVAEITKPQVASVEAQRKALAQPDITVTIQQTSTNVFQWNIKASGHNKAGILKMIEKIQKINDLKSEDCQCKSVFELRPVLLSACYGLFKLSTVRWIAAHTNTQMQFSAQDPFIVILGEPSAILHAREYLTGLLPVTLLFDRQNDGNINMDRGFTRRLEEEFSVKIIEKEKTGSSGAESLFLIRTHEANLTSAYRTRLLILNEPSEFIPNEYEFMKDLQLLIKQSESVLIKPRNHMSAPIFSQSVNVSLMQEPPDSPDPKESPIAHSLLSGVRSFNSTNARESFTFCNQKNVFDRNVNEETTQNLWNGTSCSFSSSLPARILQADLQEIWDTDERNDNLNSKDVSYNQSNSNQNQLASVLEEDEPSDYNVYNNSNLSARMGANQTDRIGIPPGFNQSLGFGQSANTFINSTNSSLGSDMNWDIRSHTEPQTVLSQLGCSEYLKQFKEQEIDMQAFLLLDETNLKDIGVVTMGARKKIYNAILKLRDSAERQGYVI
ncbi:unnamed protein product [Bursaphelenchus okinawaensis]|uniref:SAM domain-containing protein n=1 Tax=Bursaphelenchus okinawaensis TaxID=465554 RepID=A0A811KNS7_9BILA|nr:unnamed protein product [Bursaphelenchus okinawaensis]CAG9109227.1 unnamed protein product [Bursaphelenchus okinawaensis]